MYEKGRDRKKIALLRKKVLNFIESAFVVFVFKFGQFFKKLALFFRKLFGSLHVEFDKLVAPLGAVEHGHALAAEPEDLFRLRARRYF